MEHMWFDPRMLQIHKDNFHNQLLQIQLQLIQEHKVDIVQIQQRSYQENNIHIHSVWSLLEFQVHIQHIHMMQLQH